MKAGRVPGHTVLRSPINTQLEKRGPAPGGTRHRTARGLDLRRSPVDGEIDAGNVRTFIGDLCVRRDW